MLGDKNVRFVESNLQHLREQNLKICREIRRLPYLLMRKCHLIGATRPNGDFQVKVSKTHLDVDVFSSRGLGQRDNTLSQEQMMGIFPVSESEIPNILPLVAGKSLWMVKCKLSREMLQKNSTLKDLICSSRMTDDIKITLYCFINPEHSQFFFKEVHSKSLGPEFKTIPNFLQRAQLLYVRVRGTQEDKEFCELHVLKDIVNLKADFFVRDERKVFGEKKWWVVRSMSCSDNPPLGAEGEVSRSKEKTGRQQAAIVVAGLQNLSVCLESAISKDEDLSRSSSRK
ncbi:DUF3023 domain-containing protein [Ehrlichia japonica]|uniref:Uncharacterized protein n=1 Tax=Ehrlichia japonica TaxID=391036 RepID=X5GKJ8_9RICK|nr:DUF3023 domain-containing protein [Ehrlichia japonica]AHX04666.1 hypothetical protein EHF_0621 [Ehrlichia japonica]